MIVHIYIYIYIYICIYVYIKLNGEEEQQQLQPCSWCRGGVENEWFQQSAPTHSGAGEKETLNINVVGKITKGSLDGNSILLF